MNLAILMSNKLTKCHSFYGHILILNPPPFYIQMLGKKRLVKRHVEIKPCIYKLQRRNLSDLVQIYRHEIVLECKITFCNVTVNHFDELQDIVHFNWQLWRLTRKRIRKLFLLYINQLLYLNKKTYNKYFKIKATNEGL